MNKDIKININTIPIIGSIAGDIIGSRFEHRFNIPSNFVLFTNESTFTDDTVQTISVLNSLIRYTNVLPSYNLRKDILEYSDRGFSQNTIGWAKNGSSNPVPSFGNGAAMRISPIGALAENKKALLRFTKWLTMMTHSHPEATKGASAIAYSIFLAKNGKSKKEIKKEITHEFIYDLDLELISLERYRGNGELYTCQLTVPYGIACFLQSEDYEDCIRKAICLGGDTDTLACMAGGIAAAYYNKIPDEIIKKTLSLLPKDFQKSLEICGNLTEYPEMLR